MTKWTMTDAARKRIKKAVLERTQGDEKTTEWECVIDALKKEGFDYSPRRDAARLMLEWLRDDEGSFRYIAMRCAELWFSDLERMREGARSLKTVFDN